MTVIGSKSGYGATNWKNKRPDTINVVLHKGNVKETKLPVGRGALGRFSRVWRDRLNLTKSSNQVVSELVLTQGAPKPSDPSVEAVTRALQWMTDSLPVDQVHMEYNYDWSMEDNVRVAHAAAALGVHLGMYRAIDDRVHTNMRHRPLFPEEVKAIWELHGHNEQHHFIRHMIPCLVNSWLDGDQTFDAEGLLEVEKGFDENLNSRFSQLFAEEEARQKNQRAIIEQQRAFAAQRTADHQAWVERQAKRTERNKNKSRNGHGQTPSTSTATSSATANSTRPGSPENPDVQDPTANAPRKPRNNHSNKNKNKNASGTSNKNVGNGTNGMAVANGTTTPPSRTLANSANTNGSPSGVKTMSHEEYEALRAQGSSTAKLVVPS